MGAFSFSKSERLSKRNSIQELFSRGSSFYIHPFKVLLMENPESGDGHQVLFSVSKRNCKRAVQRNLIKRRMREAYRINKSRLPESPKLHLAYIYTSRDILDFHTIEEKFLESFKRLHQHAAKG
ncbi:MAG: ribonuclease P protein component [Cyclobacteriaceae bacterium]|nr:ribonuclease P protein component [Cyclobacteriaceae bacterium]